MRAIEAYPSRLWGVRIMDLFADDADERLRRVVGHDRMLGVRMHTCLEYDAIPAELNRDATWILDDELAPVWKTAADLGTPVFVFPKAQQLDAVADLADAHPDVTLVVDHMAYPDDTTAPDEEPWTRFRLLAEHENVYVKIISLPRSSDEGFPYHDLHGYVRALLDWFGADRLMLGSDYPWMDSWTGYEDCISWPERVDFLSARDLAYLSYCTFEEVHG